MLRERIAPPGSAPSKGERIREAARILGWKFSRVFAVWYGDERVSLKPRELRQIEELTGIRYGKQEIADTDALIERATAFLERPSASVHRSFFAALRTFVGSLDRTGTGG
jgi:hypothetical protein